MLFPVGTMQHGEMLVFLFLFLSTAIVELKCMTFVFLLRSSETSFNSLRLALSGHFVTCMLFLRGPSCVPSWNFSLRQIDTDWARTQGIISVALLT